MAQHIAHNISKKTWTEDIKIQDNVTFFQMGFSQNILDGLIIAGVQRSSRMQLEVILQSRCGFNLIIGERSVTGKTLVFGIIALEMLDIQLSSPQVLIIAPTEEIAIQKSHIIKVIGSKIEGLNVGYFVKRTLEEDQKKLSKCHVIIGPPDDVKYLIERKFLKVSTIRLFVLDEADKLLENNYQKSIKYIFFELPSSTQVIAAYDKYDGNRKTTEKFLEAHIASPVYIGPEYNYKMYNTYDIILIKIKQFVTVVSTHSSIMKQIQTKVDELVKIFTTISFKQCLIFTNCQSRAQLVSNIINSMGFSSLHISENQNMTNRSETIELRNFESRILVTTDLTARGINTQNINMVINFDIPIDATTYLRRMGRARILDYRYEYKYGISITIISENELLSFTELFTSVGGPNFYLLKLNYAKNVWALKTTVFEKVYLKSKKSHTEFSDIDKAILESENDTPIAIPIQKISPQINDISKNNISSAIKYSERGSVAFKNIATNDTCKNDLPKHVASNGTSLSEDYISNITAVKDNICKDILPKNTTINDTSSAKNDIASIITIEYEKHKSVLKDRKCHGVVYNNTCLKPKRTNLEKKKKISSLFEHYSQERIQGKANFRQSTDISEECKKLSTTTDLSKLKNIHNTMTCDYINSLMEQLNKNLLKVDFLNMQDYKLSNADIEDISEYVKSLLINEEKEEEDENMKENMRKYNEKVSHDTDSAKDSIAIYSDDSMYSDGPKYNDDGLMSSDDELMYDDDMYSDGDLSDRMLSENSSVNSKGQKRYHEILCQPFYHSRNNPMKELNDYLLQYSFKIKINNISYDFEFPRPEVCFRSNWEKLLNLEIDLSDNMNKSMTDSIHKLVYEEYYSALKIFLCIQKQALVCAFLHPYYDIYLRRNSDNKSMYKEIEDFQKQYKEKLYIKEKVSKIRIENFKYFKYFPYPTNIKEYMPNLKMSSSEIEEYCKALQYLETYGDPNKKLLEIIDYIAFLSETEHHNLIQKIKDEKLSFLDMKTFLIEETAKRDLENNKLTEYLQGSEKSTSSEKDDELIEPLQTFEKSVLLKNQEDKTTHQKQDKTDVSRINIVNNTNLKTKLKKKMQEASNEVTDVNQNKHVEIESTKCNILTNTVSHINQIEVLVNKDNSNVRKKSSFQMHKKKDEEDDGSISSESVFHTPEDLYSSAELIFNALSREQKIKSTMNSCKREHNKENTYTEKEKNNPTEQQAGLSNKTDPSCQTRSEYIPADSCPPPTHKIHGLDGDRTNDTPLYEMEIDTFLSDLRRQTDQLHLQIYKKQMFENWISYD